MTHRNRWSIADGRVDLRRAPLEPRPIELPAVPSPLVFDASRGALIVVDMQNDFCTEGGWLSHWGVDVSGAVPVVAALRDLVPAARAAGLPVIWVNWGNRVDQANLPPGVVHLMDPGGEGRGIGSVLENGSASMVRDSWGAALVDDLKREPGDIDVDKYRLSGFWDTPLDSILRNLRVDTLFLAGVNSDQCVYSTLIDAAALGYDVVLVDGASGTTSPAYCHEATLYNTRQCYGFTVEASDLTAELLRH